MNRDRVYILHILDCMEAVRQHLDQRKEDQTPYQGFIENATIQAAILRTLHIMAESTQRLSSVVKDQFPDIPWQDIADFRNVLVHDYLGTISPEIVWQTIQNDLPPLEKVMQQAKKMQEKDS